MASANEKKAGKKRVLERLVEHVKPPKKSGESKKAPKSAGGPGRDWIPGMTPHDGYGIR